MKILNKCKKAAILATVLSGMCLGSSADAAVVLVGGATDYSSGTQVGVLNGSWVTSHVDNNVVLDKEQVWFDKSVYDQYSQKSAKYEYLFNKMDNAYRPKMGSMWQYYYIWENNPTYRNMAAEEFFTEEVLAGYLELLTDSMTSGRYPDISYLANDCDIHRVVLNGKAYAYIRQTTGSGTVAVDGIVIDLAKWDTEGSAQYKGKTDSINSHGVVGKGNFIYCADYTGCRIAVGELDEATGKILNRSNLTIDLKKDLAENASIDFNDDKYYIHGENLTVDGNYLYVLTNVNKGGEWVNYQPSYLIKYRIEPTGGLKYVDHTTMGLNTDTVRLDKYNNHILTTAIGGYQNYGNPNDRTSLDFASINEDGKFGASGPIKIPQNIKDAASEFRNLRILPNGTAYVLCYSIATGGYQTGMTVYKTTISNLLADKPQNWEVVVNNGEVSGWFNNIDAEYYTKRVWVREGNNLTLYVDGIKVHTWAAKEFATSDLFTTMQAFDVMTPEGISGKLTNLNELANKVTIANAVWNDNATVESITADKTLSGDTAIIADNSKVDLGNNILAAVYAKDNNISITSNNLQLQSKNTIATPVGIYAGNGKEVNVKADNLNIITKGYENGNSLTNAIWLDPGATGNQAKITIKAPVNISMTGGIGGNGIAIQKTDRWGESSTEAAQKAEVIIKGSVSIKGADNKTWGINANTENVFSRFNNAGILTAVNNSSVTVDGNVYLDVYGNGIATTAQGSSVTVNGGEITVPTGTGYGYYTLASYLGTINMNTGADGATAGSDTVKLDGDIFALKDTGNINLALTTAESYLNGAIDNGGNVKLYLQNGATWNNVANNSRYYLDSEDTGSLVGSGRASHVNTFVGGATKENAGVIYQGLNSENIKIDNYSGNAVVLYEHNDENKLTGGNVTIGSAAENSFITLRTNYNSSMEDVTTRDAVLDDMANKLFYTAYVQNERNLNGNVEIAEGLLTSAKTMYYSGIAFSDVSGQGYAASGGVVPEPEPEVPPVNPDVPGGDEPVDPNPDNPNPEPGGDEPVVPPVEPDVPGGNTEKVVETYNYPINNFEVAMQAADGYGDYYEVYSEIDGSDVIDFGKLDTADKEVSTIVLNTSESMAWEGMIEVVPKDMVDKPFVIEMDGKDLVLAEEKVNMSSYGICTNGGGKITINNAGNITIDANATDGDGGICGASAIYANGKDFMDNIQEDTFIKIDTVNGDKVVTLEAESINNDKAVLHAENKAKVEINGIVDIAKTNGKEAVMVGTGAEVSLNGGVIGGTDDEVAIHLKDGGAIKVNQVEGKSYDVVTNGDIVLEGETTAEAGASKITYGTKDSSHNGDIVNNGTGAQNFAVEFANGAVWNGTVSGVNLALALNNDGVWNSGATDASVKSLNGANGFVNMGVGNLNIASYSGDTTFVYNNVNGVVAEGGAVTVATAAENSSVTMRTAYNASLEDATIREQAFDDLAEKLTYSAYVQDERNLTGKVEIAEGLLTGAVTKYVDDIAFNAESGQGYIEKESEPEVPPVEPDVPGGDEPVVPPVEDDKEETFDKGFTGDITTDSENFKDANGDSIVEVKPEEGKVVIDFGKLNEGKEEGKETESFKIEVPENTEKDTVVSAIQAPVIKYADNNIVDNGNTEIDMGGKEFTGNVKVSGEGSDAYGIVAKDSHIQVNNVGNITLNVEATGDGGSASALLADGKNIELTTLEGSVVTLKASDNAGESDKSTAVLQAQNAGNVTINGKVDITGTAGKDAVSVGKGSTVTIGGGVIGDEGGVAVRVNEEGKVNIGGTEQVNIKGKIIFGEANEPVTTIKSRKFMSRSLPLADVNIDLTKAGSTLEDDLQYIGSGSNNIANVQISGEGSEWTGNSVGGINLNVVLDEDGVWKGYHEDEKSYAALNMQISNGAIWENTAKENDPTNVNSLSGDGGYIQMSRNAGTDLNIGAYSGSTTFVYKNNDGNITGGNLKIESVAGDKATVNLRTNSFNGVNDEDKVVDVLNKLASKLYYAEADQTQGGATTAVAASDAKLSGELQIAEGLLTDEGTMKFAGISFGIDGKVENVTADKVQIRNDGFQTTETTAVRISKSAMASSVMMWRNESDDVMQRMGDLRLGTEENGIWAKYYNGDASYNEAGTIYNSNYKAYQVGYDKKLDNGWTVGAALSYNDAEHKYEMGTKGEGTAVGVTAYGAWNNDKGHFANIAVKGSQLDNEFDVTNATRDLTASGDYSTWGLSVSAEYGRRMEQSNGFYFEPSAKLTIGRVQDAEYTVTTDDGQQMFVEQGGFNSIVGELGVGMGKRFERGTVFTKFALAHEFAGDFSSNFMDSNSRIVKSDADFGGSWYEWQLGGSVKVNDNSYVYATYEKTFGGDAARDWRVDAGVRWTF